MSSNLFEYALISHFCFLEIDPSTADTLPSLFGPDDSLARHVILPQDIAKLLPKGRLLSEARKATLTFLGKKNKQTNSKFVIRPLFFFDLSCHRLSGGLWAFSNRVDGSIMPSTVPSPTLCFSGETRN